LQISVWPHRFVVAGVTTWAFSLGTACGNGPSEPARGELELAVMTTGVDLDPDGYLVVLDENAPQRIAPNQTFTLSDLMVGTHQVEVSDIASNCTLAGDNPRTLTVVGGRATQVPMEVACSALPGSLRVTVTSSGWDVDPDGYTLILDGNPAGTLAAEDVLTLPSAQAGAHTVTLTGVAPNCALRIPRQLSLTIHSEQESAIAFTVLCTLASGPTGEQIVYESASQVMSVRSDGTGASPLTAAPGRAFVPSWSPDRTRIAFASDRASGEFNIWTASADGSNPVRLTDVAGDRSASWSPDGTRLVISSLTGQPGLYVVNSDGTDRVRITDGPTDAYPAWSPDGTRIMFARDNGLGTPIQLYVVQPDGGGLAQFPTPGVKDCVYPQWAPDGTRLAFSGYDSAGGAVWVVNDDGSGLVRLTPPSMVGFTPSWSTRGDRLVFVGQASGGDGLYTVASDGSGLALQLSDVQATSPAWAR
jgi:Tol biopolymer transport system component